MEQRARAAGKTGPAAIYRKYINSMKKKTKAKNKKLNSHFDRDKILANYYVDGYVNTPCCRIIKADESKPTDDVKKENVEKKDLSEKKNEKEIQKEKK